ncbi:MAG TPA: DUF4367 domain-containing protein [Candidatus Saccharimonadales bacterium]|nr:DUF4367 domain-containing protein [Candidatus Saccharimonadales bacterium]
MSQKTITINGRVYDAHTGMPLDDVPAEQTLEPEEKTSPKRSPLHHKSIHSAPQKSQTLNRRVVKKIAATPKKVRPTAQAHSVKPPVAKSPAITRFAPHPAGVKPRVMRDIGPTVHPHVTKTQQKIDARKQPIVSAPPKASKVIKEEAIQKAMAKTPSKTDNAVKTKRTRRLPRFASVASAGFALLLLGAYFTYLNMPNLSVRVAAAQAGIDASYPEYRPDGYSLRGPIGYDEGQVTMKFAANAGPQQYSIEQTKSSWDSSAVLENYVKQKAGDNYITYNERGLTIYTFDGNAAWVNGGILYTISGDAPLSSDQIRRIATSM